MKLFITTVLRCFGLTSFQTLDGNRYEDGILGSDKEERKLEWYHIVAWLALLPVGLYLND